MTLRQVTATALSTNSARYPPLLATALHAVSLVATVRLTNWRGPYACTWLCVLASYNCGAAKQRMGEQCNPGSWVVQCRRQRCPLHLLWEDAVSDASQHLAVLRHQRTAAVPPVQQQPADVLLWHVGQLLAENHLQAHQPGRRVVGGGKWCGAEQGVGGVDSGVGVQMMSRWRAKRGEQSNTS